MRVPSRPGYCHPHDEQVNDPLRSYFYLLNLLHFVSKLLIYNDDGSGFTFSRKSIQQPLSCLMLLCWWCNRKKVRLHSWESWMSEAHFVTINLLEVELFHRVKRITRWTNITCSRHCYCTSKRILLTICIHFYCRVQYICTDTQTHDATTRWYLT